VKWFVVRVTPVYNCVFANSRTVLLREYPEKLKSIPEDMRNYESRTGLNIHLETPPVCPLITTPVTYARYGGSDDQSHIHINFEGGITYFGGSKDGRKGNGRPGRAALGPPPVIR
jgi:hypothetical protein